MKVTFILAAIGKKKDKPYIKTWNKMEPLTIAVLNALTPREIEREFFDDRIEMIDYDTDTDVVAITFETYSSKRAYQIARKFNERGKTVIMGGPHATLMPDEVKEYCDSVLIGNAESCWVDFLNDYRYDRIKPFYKGKPSFTDMVPDRRIFQGKRYAPLGLIETGRGCTFKCEFCTISACYNSTYHQRSLDAIRKEIEANRKLYYFLVDDNVVAKHNYAISMFKELSKLKVRWTGQGSLTVAKNPELLKWMKKSGCEVLLIGFESLIEENLKQMNKQWNKPSEMGELVKRIHDAGIGIYATFVFGFDYDTPEAFDKALEFALRQKFFFAAFNHLLPFPNTPLYKRLSDENRMRHPKWWLKNGYRYGDIPFIPKNMSPEELFERCTEARNVFFKNSNIFKRWLNQLRVNPNPILSYVFLSQNANLKKDVMGRAELPLGENLDDYPK
jgi:radical SAM superfamily enzyme YgiQ (UPF0313 family)